MQCPTSNETYAQNWVRLYAGQEHWARLDEETYALNRGYFGSTLDGSTGLS